MAKSATPPATPITTFGGLSVPGIVTLVGYLILAIIVLVPLDMYVYDEEKNVYERMEYRFANRVLVMLLLLFPFFLGIYSVNCMMVGRCQLWSWIVALATLIWACLVVITATQTGAFRVSDVVV